MTSVSTVLNTRAITEIGTKILSSYDSSFPYRRVPPPRAKNIDPAPSKFKNTLPELIKGGVKPGEKHSLMAALGAQFKGAPPNPFMPGIEMRQKADQHVEGGEAAQKIEQVLKSTRDWRL
jgi:hypothetical protein